MSGCSTGTSFFLNLNNLHYMQYDVATPSEYLDALQNDWRKSTLLEIRDLILISAPDIKEAIDYKMLSYKLVNVNAFHLNAQKNFVGLYVGSIDKIDPDKRMLADFDCGKGCIRIKKTHNISQSLLPEFIETTISKIKSGFDTSC